VVNYTPLAARRPIRAGVGPADRFRWVIRNQLGRWNLTPAEAAYYRGLEYLEEERPIGRPSNGSEKSAQNEHIKTSERLADQYGVGQASIRRDAQFAQALDRLPPTRPRIF